MLKDVTGTVAQAQHVLFDSWFSSPKAIREIKHLGLGYDVVARLKKISKHHYIYQGQKLSISQIFKMNKCCRGRSRYLQSVEVSIAGDENTPETPARIVYVRNRNKRNDWLAILSTDMSLTPDEIITLYGKRWDIEPFHRVLKSNLKLEKEFQVRSFDAIVAHANLVLLRYLFLAGESP
jgi:IS4 transposase